MVPVTWSGGPFGWAPGWTSHTFPGRAPLLVGRGQWDSNCSRAHSKLFMDWLQLNPLCPFTHRPVCTLDHSEVYQVIAGWVPLAGEGQVLCIPWGCCMLWTASGNYGVVSNWVLLTGSWHTLCMPACKPAQALCCSREFWCWCWPAVSCTLLVRLANVLVILAGAGPADGSRQQSGTSGSSTSMFGYGYIAGGQLNQVWNWCVYLDPAPSHP